MMLKRSSVVVFALGFVMSFSCAGDKTSQTVSANTPKSKFAASQNFSKLKPRAFTNEKSVKHNVYYYQRATLFGSMEVKSTDIIFLGDSQTDGCEWNELFDNPNCKNRGINSDVVDGYYDRIEPIVAGHPCKIFILGGINDVAHGRSAASISRSMEQLIVRIKKDSPSTNVYLESLLPINNDKHIYKALTGKQQVVIAVNQQYRAVADRQHVTFVDLYSRFVGSDGKMPLKYSNDGLHLLGDGYLLWRDVLLPYLK